jgi:hypothetical protein
LLTALEEAFHAVSHVPVSKTTLLSCTLDVAWWTLTICWLTCHNSWLLLLARWLASLKLNCKYVCTLFEVTWLTSRSALNGDGLKSQALLLLVLLLRAAGI